MGSLFGSSGSGGAAGNKGAQDVYVPPFTSPGGVTPAQTDFAQYGVAEGDLGNAGAYSALPDSTMVTQADAGTGFKGAETLGQTSDINQGAEYTAYSNQVKSDLAQLAQNANVNTTNLNTEAAALGGLLGQNQGGSTTAQPQVG